MTSGVEILQIVTHLANGMPAHQSRKKNAALEMSSQKV